MYGIGLSKRHAKRCSTSRYSSAKAERAASSRSGISATCRCGYNETSYGQRAKEGTNAVHSSFAVTTRVPVARSAARISPKRLVPCCFR
ncbi:Uncharacterised protein [Mycobacteroides abscessus subsp. abscessus]|nr:Uncharacterised protein [Mycobacteroides abscessus subsp. abscessus]